MNETGGIIIDKFGGVKIDREPRTLRSLNMNVVDKRLLSLKGKPHEPFGAWRQCDDDGISSLRFWEKLYRRDINSRICLPPQ